MAAETTTIKKDRLNDFITLAQQGNKVSLIIELRKKVFKEKLHPDETEDMATDQDMYFLIGEFTGSVNGEAQEVIAKVYVFGSTEESLVASSGNKNIANQRLKMDYERLRSAGVEIEEAYF